PGLPTARTIRCFRLRVPSPQKSSRLLLIKPAELLLFLTGADRPAPRRLAPALSRGTRNHSVGGIVLSAPSGI
ncbi:MAG: hypothetical protein ACLQVM_07760, partial [Terriglobia bacterium]